MKSALLTVIGGLAVVGVNALVLEKRSTPATLSVPFVREPQVALRRHKRAGTVLAPLMNEQFLLYTATLAIGTPPQMTRVQIDTGSSYLIVETDSSNLCTSDPTVCSIRGACKPPVSVLVVRVNANIRGRRCQQLIDVPIHR